MKVVIAQTNLTLKGGAERVLLKIAQRYDAKIYTAEYDKNKTFDEFKNLDVEIVGKTTATKLLPYGRAAQGLNYGLSFYNLKLRDDYDVINAHMAPSHWIRNRNDRVLWYCHTPLRDIYDLYEYRLALRKPHQRPVYIIGAKFVKNIDQQVVKKIERIVANSNNTNSRIKKYYGINNAKVLNGGIDYEMYRDNGDGRYFIYVSRISPNKRQDMAIKAFNIFKKRIKGYRLLLVGPVSKDKFYYDYYKDMVELSKIVKDVQFVINPSDAVLRRLYSRCTASLYPPMNEDYGLVPIESAASRKPVIAIKEGGPAETILNNGTGYLVSDAEEMAQKMAYLAEHPKIAEHMGRLGRKRVEANYSWNKFFKGFDKELRLVAKLK